RVPPEIYRSLMLFSLLHGGNRLLSAMVLGLLIACILPSGRLISGWIGLGLGLLRTICPVFAGSAFSARALSPGWTFSGIRSMALVGPGVRLGLSGVGRHPTLRLGLGTCPVGEHRPVSEQEGH